jgi:hypothetical protein
MTEWKLFDGAVPHVSTAEFHADRERAPHLEQPAHRPRLDKAAEFIRSIEDPALTVSDLGCGDGGLLSLIQHDVGDAWGFDFCPANSAGWAERGVRAELLDVFGADLGKVRFGVLTVVTEVLEHLADPRAAVRWIGDNSRWIVASSPWNENAWNRDPCHAWAWDRDGYRELIEQGGFQILRHEDADRFQVILGVKS